MLTKPEELKAQIYTTNSKEVNKGDCFIAIKGENNNGNVYVEDAFKKGAAICIVDEMPEKNIIDKYNNRAIIKVENTILALQSLAKNARENNINIPLIAVTGSVGKTSTKDIIASVVGKKYKVLKTEANLNNHIGLPLTLLKLEDHEAIVVEMGMNHKGEISVLTNIAKPDIAIITNVGTSHIGNLGSRENILKAKLEILEGLKKDGKIVINNDNDLLHKWNEEESLANVYTYGINVKSTVMATDIIEDELGSKFKVENNEININIPGDHFIYNALCAYTVGKILRIDISNIKEGIKNFALTNKRMEINKVKGITLIEDYYNASYESTKESLKVLKNSKGKRKIAVLGDMLELGEFSSKMHKKVGAEAAKNNIDILITIGKESINISEEAKKQGLDEVYHFITNEDAIKFLKEILYKDDAILLKASNAMNFGTIAEALKK